MTANACWADAAHTKESALNPDCDVDTGLAADQASDMRTKK